MAAKAVLQKTKGKQNDHCTNECLAWAIYFLITFRYIESKSPQESKL